MAAWGSNEHVPPSPGFGDGAEESDEDAPIDPVYLRLDDKVLRSYYHYDLDEAPFPYEDEVGDDQVGLDLTSPPAESWFHGRISRQTACTRLQEMYGEQGVYLVRESETQPGDYAISYLSNTGYVHHFKINSNCGDYYIGGRQFYSLSDLIGFYSNCSHILENESLEVPVVPPRPVSLYLMLMSTAVHRKTPGRDELNIEPMEVFILLSRLNDDWGWARSQRTGESGLIPLSIMEDVTNKDCNIGKVWFHGHITREDAVDLLMREGIVGSFLVRISKKTDVEIQYSLAVKTPDKVQRFRITKFPTGYYLFGGRPFNSIEEILERYRNEVIIDGVKLGAPVPNDPPTAHMLHELQLNNSRSEGTRSTRANSIILTQAQMQGEKTSSLLLRKGKKSPVYGKWKEFYFVVKFGEQKLLYYDHENSHKAKGLLDLKQCQVYAVDRTLYGRNDCLLVMLHYLNELSFYYLAAGTQENAQEWLRLLQRYSISREDTKSEVQQIRSLSLSIRDSKLNKSTHHGNVYCLVALDGACLARTMPVQIPCIFDENYYFQDLPLTTTSFSVEMMSAKKILTRDPSIGRVNIYLSDLPNGREDDKWHHLLTRTAKTQQGSLRLVTNFKHEIILPIEEYKSLKALVLNSDLLSIEALAKVCKDHHAELASTLIRVFCHYKKTLLLVNRCIEKSIIKEDNVATLFRASTLSTMLMDQLMKLTASEYLHSVLRGPIQQIAELRESCELDPTKLPKGTDLSPNLTRMEAHLQNVLSSIFLSVSSFPVHLRYIFHCLQDQVVQKWPTDRSVRTRAVSGFLFLRFICPAIINPLHFNLLQANPSEASSRTLKLVAKAVQNIANLVEFKTKEPFMTTLNPFITKRMPDMIKFIDDLSNAQATEEKSIMESPEQARDLASIYHLCCTYEKGLEQLRASPSEHADVSAKLLDLMQSLRIAEKTYLVKYRGPE